jgi:hypothetical protein
MFIDHFSNQQIVPMQSYRNPGMDSTFTCKALFFTMSLQYRGASIHTNLPVVINANISGNAAGYQRASFGEDGCSTGAESSAA